MPRRRAEPVVSIGGGGFGINLHLAPADLVAALGAQVADISEPDREHAESLTPSVPARTGNERTRDRVERSHAASLPLHRSIAEGS